MYIASWVIGMYWLGSTTSGQSCPVWTWDQWSQGLSRAAWHQWSQVLSRDVWHQWSEGKNKIKDKHSDQSKDKAEQPRVSDIRDAEINQYVLSFLLLHKLEISRCYCIIPFIFSHLCPIFIPFLHFMGFLLEA